jgi:flavin reductase (DIM6/NTAB) family NADH-FMN oxidoreductase RutF
MQDTELSPLSPEGESGVQQNFRDVMAGVCSPVSVVTACAQGRPHGTTVSAFASLSMDPPMVMVSLDRSSRILPLIRQTGVFGLNVLTSGQSALALHFARKEPDKFDGLDWSAVGGVPRLPGTSGFLLCRVSEYVPGGDHLILLGLVHAAEAVDDAPLTYHRRVFGTHTPSEVKTRDRPHSTDASRHFVTRHATS